jgi:hypothetical protein
MVLELGRHRRVVEEVFDPPGAQRAGLLQRAPEEPRARPPVVPPWGVEQNQREGLLHPGQRPEGDPSDRSTVLLGDKAPLGAHGPGGEHGVQIPADLSVVGGISAGLDEAVEPDGRNGTYVHLSCPPVDAWWRSKR